LDLEQNQKRIVLEASNQETEAGRQEKQSEIPNPQSEID